MRVCIKTLCEHIKFQSEPTWLTVAGIIAAGIISCHTCGNFLIGYDIKQPFDLDHVLLII